MRYSKHDRIDVAGQSFKRERVAGYADSPLGPCLCYLNPAARRIEVSEYVPLDDYDLITCQAVERYTGLSGARLVPVVGVARADGSPAA